MLPWRGGAMDPRAFVAASFSSLNPFGRACGTDEQVGEEGPSGFTEGISIFVGGLNPERFAKPYGAMVSFAEQRSLLAGHTWFSAGASITDVSMVNIKRRKYDTKACQVVATSRKTAMVEVELPVFGRGLGSKQSMPALPSANPASAAWLVHTPGLAWGCI